MASKSASQIVSREASLEALDELSAFDALCLFVGQDERPLRGVAGLVDWRLCGELSRLLTEHFFEGREGESLLLPVAGRLSVPRLFVLGGGLGKEWSDARAHTQLERAADVLRRAGSEAVALEPPGHPRDESPALAQVREGFAPHFQGRQICCLLDRH